MLPAGGWSQFPGGPPDLSVSCLSYFALKVAGESADAPDMRRSRDVILALGGVERANTYTRYHLAMFGQLPWTAVPAIPPEMLFLPRVSPFTIYDMSSWSRTIFIPLAILWARKPVVALPPACGAQELFCAPAGAAVAPRLVARSDRRLEEAVRRVDRLLKHCGARAGRGGVASARGQAGRGMDARTAGGLRRLVGDPPCDGELGARAPMSRLRRRPSRARAEPRAPRRC